MNNKTNIFTIISLAALSGCSSITPLKEGGDQPQKTSSSQTSSAQYDTRPIAESPAIPDDSEIVLITPAWHPPVKAKPVNTAPPVTATPVAASVAAPIAAPIAAPALKPGSPAVTNVAATPAQERPAASASTPVAPKVPVAAVLPAPVAKAPASPPVVTQAPEPAKSPVTAPIPVKAPEPIRTVEPKVEIKKTQVWKAEAGSTLHKTVIEWASKEKYTVSWDAADLDYPIVSPLVFSGGFEDAIKQMFSLYDRADRSFVVKGWRSQHLLKITERNKTKTSKQADL